MAKKGHALYLLSIDRTRASTWQIKAVSVEAFRRKTSLTDASNGLDELVEARCSVWHAAATLIPLKGAPALAPRTEMLDD